MILWIYFIIGLFFTLSVPAVLPSVKLFYFIPLLIRSIYLKPLQTCIWIAFYIGLCLDLLSSHSRFGIYTTNYVLTTYILFRVKQNFFEDSFTTLPVLTYFFSLTSTMIQILLLLLLDRYSIHFTSQFIFTDLILMPLYDTIFTFCVFSIPQLLFIKPPRKGSDYFI